MLFPWNCWIKFGQLSNFLLYFELRQDLGFPSVTQSFNKKISATSRLSALFMFCEILFSY